MPSLACDDCGKLMHARTSPVAQDGGRYCQKCWSTWETRCMQWVRSRETTIEVLPQLLQREYRKATSYNFPFLQILGEERHRFAERDKVFFDDEETSHDDMNLVVEHERSPHQQSSTASASDNDSTVDSNPDEALDTPPEERLDSPQGDSDDHDAVEGWEMVELPTRSAQEEVPAGLVGNLIRKLQTPKVIVRGEEMPGGLVGDLVPKWENIIQSATGSSPSARSHPEPSA
mmetsp:Transcript_54970/g.98804  ORF Transcript_54970/g.98804 Transcript_54970/m.98804 type:complete len:231 (-) Transcript_54970:58-750(-)